jgi:hypothetical protein
LAPTRRATLDDTVEFCQSTFSGRNVLAFIEYNLASFTKNLPTDVVNFTLQGDAKRSTDGLGSRPQKRGHRNGTGGLSRHEES